MVSSLPFLVVLDMCTTLARLDLGIFGGWDGVDVLGIFVFLVSNFLIIR